MQISRRNALILSGGLLLGSARFGSTAPPEPWQFGWLNDPQLRRRWIRSQQQPYYHEFSREIAGSGRGKQALLVPCLERVTGKSYQPPYQRIGDCTAQATAQGIDLLTAVQIQMHGRPERWVAPAATEPIYAGSRVEIGHGRIRARDDGTLVTWAGDWINQYGVLLRQQYGDVDLRRYNPSLARRWGSPKVGVPDALEGIAREHRVKTIKLVTCWSEARDLVYNGYPIVIGSDVGFGQVRDAEGFLTWETVWYHSMVLAGIDDKSRRVGGLLLNSWGNDWVEGPQHKLGTPAGGFWVDAKTIDRMLSVEDSLALSNYVGYRRQPRNYMLVPQ